MMVAAPTRSGWTDLHRFVGDGEVHLTLAAEAGGRSDALLPLADRCGAKLVLIELARGATPVQPMLTLARRGRADALWADSATVAAELAAAGWPVLRRKLEVNADADGVAADDPIRSRRDFEHHVKILVTLTTDRAALTDLAMAHGGHLSVNARRRRDDGGEERFITQRARCARPAALAGFAALRRALAAQGLLVLDHVEEYILADDRPQLDAGWLPEMPA